MKQGKQIGSYLEVLGKSLWIEQYMVNSEANPTLVFLHEGLGCTAMWKDFPGKLCQTVGLNGLLYDRQGHGKSGALDKRREKDYLHIEALDFLPKLLEQLGIQKPILIGHSDGGTIALLYAAHFPTTAIITEAAHIYVEEVTTVGIKEAIKFYQTTSMKEKLVKYHGEKTDALFHAWADTWLDESFVNWNIQNVLPKIDVPSLIIQGEEDPYATQQHWRDIVNGLGGESQGIWLENCGHTPHKENPTLMQKAIQDFINDTISNSA